MGWPAIARGDWTLIFAPTGSGKTLTAFLWALDRLMFAPRPPKERRCRVVYISPLKALAVDVERNLRAPLAGIANLAAERGDDVRDAVDRHPHRRHAAAERARFLREPADILITTPESLYLMLTSNAREMLRGVETVIIDEIHALVPNKRGAHLALSLERLAAPLRTSRRSGSACRRRSVRWRRWRGFWAAWRRSRESPAVGSKPPTLTLGNPDELDDPRSPHFRPVTIVDTGEKKQLSLRVEVPVEEMAKLGESRRRSPSGPAAAGPARASIWPAIHPRLLELIRAHRSTLIFVNSRRLAERLAGALNELAGETLVQAHHGSIARAQRIEIEDNLKSGRLPALVATSSLELGIDMGAIDLVIQIEAPPSIASGMQRIGRAGASGRRGQRRDHLPEVSAAICSPAPPSPTPCIDGAIEPTRYPRNPLDVLAQQIVAMIADGRRGTPTSCSRSSASAAPFAELARTLVRRRAGHALRPLSLGRIRRAAAAHHVGPRHEHAHARGRARSAWPSSAAARFPTAACSASSSPAREKMQSARVGELDEEMVFESRVGETFLLGASTWRIEEITHDRVLVTPAPGEPGKMPFWKADAAERTVPFGEAIGALVREVGAMQPRRRGQTPDVEARSRRARREELPAVSRRSARRHRRRSRRPHHRHRARARRARRLARLRPHAVRRPHSRAVGDGGDGEGPQRAADRRRDDVERRRLHRPLPRHRRAAARGAGHPRRRRGRAARGPPARRELACSPRSSAKPPRARCCCRAIAPDRRTPLWQQRKRAYDLLQVASRFGSFPIILETYREVLRDVFDVPALVATMKKIQQRTIRVVVADTEKPSPFAGSLLFRYVANFIYDGDAPLAERRAQALAIDQAQLRELLGEPELRELLDADALDAARAASCSISTSATKRSRVDALHDLLLRLGDLSLDEIAARSLVDAKDAIARAGEGAPHHRNPDRAREALHRHRGRQPLPRRARRRRFRTASPSATCSRSPIPPAISCSASRARTARSRRPTSRSATASASRS